MLNGKRKIEQLKTADRTIVFKNRLDVYAQKTNLHMHAYYGNKVLM